ncbi:MAG TPA: GNAT family N-acetyltransferase [Puia sp.]|nr:GNAT family N-acetyltransferase [Puia sp.]
MNSPYHIRYLRRPAIDLQKWDACIDRSTNGLIYGRSFYLDHMTAGQWDALVLEDYAVVLPLTWKQKAGIRYLYQPAFTQQLGIFSPTPPPAALIEDFLAHLNIHFRFAEIFFNFQNAHPSLQAYTNFILPLDIPYTQLSAQYKKGLVKSLKLATRSSFQYIHDFDLPTALDLNQQQYQHRTPHVRETTYRQFKELCLFLAPAGKVLLRALTDHRQQPLAIALLLREKDRMYLLQSTVLPAGRQTAANHLLLDHLIREFAGTPMILDFEGSEIPGIAHFYRNFGAKDQPYYFYRHNRLPWPFLLFKN